MLLTALIVIATLLPVAERGIEAGRVRASDALRGLALARAGAVVAPSFLPEARAVSNWRDEAGRSLRPASLALTVRYGAAEPAFVGRCVKLNNYWCIKSARWNGEIGADAEGHTGFATAADGADAAAQLLRRYYRDLGRRSALAIVRRWAPAECRLPGAAPAPAGPVAKSVAPLGLKKTLRARYLARNTPGGMPRRAVGIAGRRLRVQPWSARALMAKAPGAGAPSRVRMASQSPDMPVPAPAPTPGLLVRPSVIVAKPSVLLVRPSELLVGPSPIVEAPARRPAPARGPTPKATRTTPTPEPSSLADRLAAESAALPSIAAGLPGLPLLDLYVPVPVCATDEARIRNYATRIAASVGLKVDDDLGLFGPDGRPAPNLAPVMLAMSAVELGTLRAGPALVEAAVARLAESGPKPTPAAGP